MGRTAGDPGCVSPAEVVSKHIVVGVDMSPASREALEWARLVAARVDADVAVVHAGGLLETAIGTGLLPAHSARAQIAAGLDRDWCAPLRRSGVRCRSQVTDGSPVDVLPHAAEVEEADLLVLGRRGTAGPSSLALGSTSLHVLEEARVPTLVVPGIETARQHRPGEHQPWRVLVGVDGSGPSLHALRQAADMAALFGGELVAATAVEREEDAPVRAIVGLADACRPLRQDGLQVRTATRRGPPAQVLLDLAASFDVDLVVVGMRGVGAPGDPLLGSVSRHVVHETDRPALVVPPGSPEHLFDDGQRAGRSER
jgi:nucleotide-binding universal stress UspA family protein